MPWDVPLYNWPRSINIKKWQISSRNVRLNHMTLTAACMTWEQRTKGGLVVLTCVIEMSRPTGKPTICIGENKDADQLRGNREADQCLCFRYSDSTIPLLLKSEISSFQLFSVLVQPGLCQTCSETTLLVFPRGGSNVGVALYDTILGEQCGLVIEHQTPNQEVLGSVPTCI